ncbi:hypothetical protein B0H11DRAFT_2262043 [Mycena galericulata]|nr:hypothetical protein B0H11DRAFT_2262043 [Mycena galericulata]
MPMSALDGSSVENPWVLNARGRLVLADNTNAPAHELRINKGPPSTIPRSLAGPRARTPPPVAGPSGPVRAGISIRDAAPRAPCTPYCDVRDAPLQHDDLYLTEARPPERPAALKLHHKCGVCWSVKSHPVSYKCGHSHCYVCIRLWLEKKWSCPDCSLIMFIAPFRHYGEEASLQADYPDWVDLSKVNHDFGGLVFPRAQLLPDSP